MKEVGVEEEEKIALDFKFRNVHKLRIKEQLVSHFDVVWEISFLTNRYLVTASEDCCVKLWDLSDLDWIDEHRWESSEHEHEDVSFVGQQEIFTYRGH